MGQKATAESPAAAQKQSLNRAKHRLREIPLVPIGGQNLSEAPICVGDVLDSSETEPKQTMILKSC